MIGRTPPLRTAPLFHSVEQGIAAIEAKYGVTIGREGWNVEELSRVHESLALLGRKEREELKGVHLARASTPTLLLSRCAGRCLGAGETTDDRLV